MILNYTDDTTKEIGPMIFTVFFDFAHDNGITEKRNDVSISIEGLVLSEFHNALIEHITTG